MTDSKENYYSDLGSEELDAITEYMHHQPKTNKTPIQTQDKIETQK